MLGRIVYVLIILAVILGGAFALNFLIEEPGTITVDYGDRTYGPLGLVEAAVILTIGVLLILVAIAIFKFVYALVRFITGDADAFGGFFSRRRERRGLDALAKGTIALSEGDPKTAQKYAKIAEQKLMRPHLTRLLNAQAAELAGDSARAETYYKALMSESPTAFVGARGLLTNAMQADDTDRALKLAERAREIKPKDRGTLETLYELQSKKFDWDGARKTLSVQRRAGHVPKPDADRRESALLLAQSEDAQNLGEGDHARALAVEAAKMDPSNVEAVSTAVRRLIESGSRKAASKLVQDAWRVRPHPTLAAAYAAIEPDEAPAARRRRFEALFSLQPEHTETQFLRAELALVAEDWPGARASIADLRETEMSARSCAIMAAAARGEGEEDHVVSAWLAKALGAPRGTASDSEIGNAAMQPLLIEPTSESPSMSVEPMSPAPQDTSQEKADVEEAETDGVKRERSDAAA